MLSFNRQKQEKRKKNNLHIETKREDNRNVGQSITPEPEYEIVEMEILPEKMICPDCGGITLVGLDYCDKCGGELINQDN